jgi:hypothetical protein
MLSVFKAHTQSTRVRVVVLNTFGGNVGKDGAEIKAAVHQWVDMAHEHGEAFAARVANELRCHILGVCVCVCVCVCVRVCVFVFVFVFMCVCVFLSV